jgi:Tfp pilus assembly protein PilV
MPGRILLNLLLLPKFHLSSERLRSAAEREQGFSLAVVLIALLSMMVAGLAMANRTQTGRLAATLHSSNREAREVAAAGVIYVISEWNRPQNRGMYTGLQPMTDWTTNNAALRNPCNDLAPTKSATSDLAGKDVVIDANRRFRIAQVIFSGQNKTFTITPGSKDTTPSFVPNQVDLVVEGIYQRGTNINRARVTKRLGLDEAPGACGGGGGGGGTAGEGLFSYGGVDPGGVPLLAKQPQTFVEGPNNTIVSAPVDSIVCLPIAPGTSAGACEKTISAGGESITIVPRDLSQAAKDALNPPTIQSIATAAGRSLPAAKSITDTLTINGNESFCINFKGAAHCNISSIDLQGNKTLTVDTSQQPVYLYTTGDIELGGKADIRHVNCGSSFTGKECTTNVNTTNFSKFNEFQETVFKFQVRGLPIANPLVSQTFSFKGTPSGNLLFWAPTAYLDLRGNPNFSSALFVNRVETKGNARITLVGQPDSFIAENNIDLSGGSVKDPALTTRSTIFTKFF